MTIKVVKKKIDRKGKLAPKNNKQPNGNDEERQRGQKTEID